MDTFTNVLKYNPYHDPKTGRFSSKGSAGASSFEGGYQKRNVVRDLDTDRVNNITDENGRLTWGKQPVSGNSLSSAQVPNYGEYDQKILAAETAGDKKLAKKLRDDMDREEVESRGLVRANDLKKGSRVLLRNGWEADLIDNGKGNTRYAKVYGDYTEMGSVYTKDILEAKVGENWKKVALSAAQRKAAKKIRAAGW